MFEALDLTSRALPQLKDICKQFGIDTKGLAKPDMVLKIIDAQAADKELATKLVEQFPKKATSTSLAAAETKTPTTEAKVKKPRIQKPIEGEAKVEKTLFEAVEEKPHVTDSNTARDEKPKFEKREEQVRKVPVHNHQKPQHNHHNNPTKTEQTESKPVVNNDLAINEPKKEDDKKEKKYFFFLI